MITPMRIIELSLRHATSEGTFQSAMQLPEGIAANGFNVVYVLPWMMIDRSQSSSPYAVVDYCTTDDCMGTLQDAANWIHRCHEVGLDVVLDIPLNHTSPNHIWCANADWYSLDESGKEHAPIGTQWKDVIQLNHRNPRVADACLDVLLYWLKLGIDGFRFDAASFIPESVLNKWLVELSGTKHMWCDGVDLRKDHVQFTSFLNHDAIRLARTDLDAWCSIVKSNADCGILYVTNHDTLHNGISPRQDWGNKYDYLLSLLNQSNQHFMLSLSDWINPDSYYSFMS